MLVEKIITSFSMALFFFFIGFLGLYSYKKNFYGKEIQTGLQKRSRLLAITMIICGFAGGTAALLRPLLI
jgi:uncharacterized membrane protein (DUF485 family)